MSHVVQMNMEVKDVDCLKNVVESLGLELVEQTSFKYYGNQKKGCEMAIRIPGNKKAFEIGVVRKQDNSGWDLEWDSYSGGYGLTAIVGEDAYKLKQGYQREVAIKHAPTGFRLVESYKQDGTLVLDYIH